uniref:Uncharacterized protein n=1 Tax=Cacopsylla melanoneura TaxID=428564 RepID=A0A8D9ECH0_9HEMI
MIRIMESNVSVKTDIMTEKIDSVSVYSSQDFSQISDYSDEEVGDIAGKTILTQDIGEDIGDKCINTVEDTESLGKQQDIEDSGKDKTTERNTGKGYQSTAPSVVDEERTNSQQTPGRNSLTKIRSDDFESTNSRINGSYQEETKKRGIRVLQPPGGFSRGLW